MSCGHVVAPKYFYHGINFTKKLLKNYFVKLPLYNMIRLESSPVLWIPNIAYKQTAL